jgi:hypothetical protein
MVYSLFLLLDLISNSVPKLKIKCLQSFHEYMRLTSYSIARNRELTCSWPVVTLEFVNPV